MHCPPRLDLNASRTSDDTAVDGVNASDPISRTAMMRGLLRVEGGSEALLFIRMFYSEQSLKVMGEQGDPLMPFLFAVGQHEALEAINDQLPEGDICWPNWTTRTHLLNQGGSARCTVVWKPSCGTVPGSAYTVASRRSGTGP